MVHHFNLGVRYRIPGESSEDMTTTPVEFLEPLKSGQEDHDIWQIDDKVETSALEYVLPVEPPDV